jgi:hypothetical protein
MSENVYTSTDVYERLKAENLPESYITFDSNSTIKIKIKYLNGIASNGIFR